MNYIGQAWAARGAPGTLAWRCGLIAAALLAVLITGCGPASTSDDRLTAVAGASEPALGAVTATAELSPTDTAPAETLVPPVVTRTNPATDPAVTPSVAAGEDVTATPDMLPATGQETGTPEATSAVTETQPVLEEYAVPRGSRPHDVAPAPDGSVWYTAQASGELGRLDPATGDTHHIALGQGSAPHGVIVGPDGAPWITDGGLNAIVRVDPESEEVQVFPLPAGGGYANLNTAAFDVNGILWFTGQSGIYGRLNLATGQVEVFEAPGGRGPYGITATPDGDIYYASLAGSHIARIDIETGGASVLEPPTAGQGARRVWSDSEGRIWVSEWNVGQVGMYDPDSGEWREWHLPGDRPQAYAVYVDERDQVWLSDFGANALVRFDPAQEEFEVYPLPSPQASVRQLLGRPGEVWGAESGVDKLVVVRTESSSE